MIGRRDLVNRVTLVGLLTFVVGLDFRVNPGLLAVATDHVIGHIGNLFTDLFAARASIKPLLFSEKHFAVQIRIGVVFRHIQDHFRHRPKGQG